MNIKSVQHSGLTDEEVIALFLETQKEQYFSFLYDKYASKIYGKCISILKDTMLAEDATQDIFTKVILNLSTFTGNSKFSTWIHSITYNFCIDILRKQKKQSTLFSSEPSINPDFEDVNDSEILEMNVEYLKKVMDKIDESDKIILLMKYQDDLMIKEIADVLDATESAIKMRLKRAKHKLKMMYDEVLKSSY